ncbi:MAG: hypothetical protein PHV85_00055 [Desulfovibrionaceae bacterium]|nr:hypothetical protein [Desulfovibrionaceae bacterium]
MAKRTRAPRPGDHVEHDGKVYVYEQLSMQIGRHVLKRLDGSGRLIVRSEPVVCDAPEAVIGADERVVRFDAELAEAARENRRLSAEAEGLAEQVKALTGQVDKATELIVRLDADGLGARIKELRDQMDKEDAEKSTAKKNKKG